VPGVGAVGAIKAGESRMDKICAKQEDSTADMGTHNNIQRFLMGPCRLETGAISSRASFVPKDPCRLVLKHCAPPLWLSRREDVLSDRQGE
jgi:hypothetical protein